MRNYTKGSMFGDRKKIRDEIYRNLNGQRPCTYISSDSSDVQCNANSYEN